MIRTFRVLSLGLLFIFVLAIPAIAENANSLFKQGRDAEARQDYEAAYTFYRQAYEQSPKDLKYRSSMERTRFLAAAAHVKRGQQLRANGKLAEALAEFDQAIAIDASSFIAQQEARRTRELIEKSKTPGAPVTPGSPLARRIEQAAGPVELAPISSTPITLKLSGDVKYIYQSIGNIAGINVLFDPDLQSRVIRVELNNVTLEDALQIVALESRTFWRAVTPNTIFVAQDNQAKRRELEQHVLRTFYLMNVSTQSEINDVANVLRNILGIQRIAALLAQNAIVVRGTPDQVALAEKIISDLDKAHPEVIVEVAVMQVNRTKLRDLGILPPTSATVQLNPNVTTTGTTVTTPTTTTTTTPTTTPSVNLNRIGNLTAKDFIVAFPAATVSFLMNDSSTKLIQNPQIRALDTQKASLKIGDRVPVATGSFGAGIGGVGLNSLVNTQFQYLDVGVNIDITPFVHGTEEVSLKVAMDISSVTGQSNIGGVNQPIIGQRKLEHTIRLREGEANLIGGIFEDNDIKNISGFPFLSQIPIFRYLFSSEHTERRENEIVFVLIPHIVRSQELTSLNLRTLDIGTETAIDIRRSTMSGQPAPAQPPVPPATQPQQPNQQQPPVPQNGPTSQGQVAPATIAFDPPILNQANGSTFSVDVVMSGQNIYSVPLQINYDPKMLQLVNVSNGPMLSRDGQAVVLTKRDDPQTGTLQVTATRPPNSGGVSGQGPVFTLTFAAKGTGQSSLVVTRAGVKDGSMQTVPANGTQSQINVK